MATHCSELVKKKGGRFKRPEAATTTIAIVNKQSTTGISSALANVPLSPELQQIIKKLLFFRNESLKAFAGFGQRLRRFKKGFLFTFLK